MARLSTQPPTPSTSSHKLPLLPKPIKLRSNFYAIPISINSTSNSVQWIYSRPHSGLGGEEEVEAGGGRKWFITGLPVGVTEKGLKNAFKSVAAEGVEGVELIAQGGDALTVLSRELATLLLDQDNQKGVTPLFTTTPSSSSSSDFLPLSTSAIISFSSTSPPPPFPPTTTNTLINFKLKPHSFLSRSLERYQLARPHLSNIISHSDTWMSSFDLRKLSSLPPSYDPLTSLSISKKKEKEKEKSKKKGKQTDPLPIPGSAAHALSLHLAHQSLQSSKSHNPDLEEEGEWTLVSRGGKHGKSLLPEGATPDVAGYGGVSVGVVKRVWEGDEGAEGGKKKKKESGVVGDGFYRFTKEEGRREELLELKRKFEEDRRRLGGGGRGGESGGRGGGGGARGGRGGSRGGGSSRGRGTGSGSGSGGRDKRAYKPY